VSANLGRVSSRNYKHFIVNNSPFYETVGQEAGVDLVLIRHFLLYDVNHVVVILTSIF